MDFFERFGIYLLIILISALASFVGWIVLDFGFENLFMLSGLIVMIIGISMNSKNSYREFGGRTGNSIIEYDTFTEIRSEKEQKGDYDYTDRSHGFDTGMKFVISGGFILGLGIILSYVIHFF